MIALAHGYFGMGNVGDEAILSVLIEELRSKGIEATILSACPTVQPNCTASNLALTSCYP
jgi:polysaccharide pyruvyl transferase WcaK-like protein